ncbi:aminoglycoside 6-adenylyltransferase [Spirosoma fluviale]|uniref:Streptomycin adenylyltransferase n=1 Tax=Spirosoma fluviale TaxID=1597977 RepID=A0A286F9L0_9BACT|nr:aminoglycoside 6-adenylyltransferase [Spirosoma fluviale]SOD79890.1 Streptomycin adenylyltransferase [Spirosoma fluviale]
MFPHLSPFQSFIDVAINVCQQDPEAVGLAAGGSWASGELDAYSDLDLVLVLSRKLAPDTEQMQAYASKFGPLLASFRGDHVGEPRLLIALYESPLLHVDIKFLTPNEFYQRVENPVILWERDQQLTSIIDKSEAVYPPFDFQWTEDRFWVWMHYAALKIGRGECFEAMDFLSFVRNMVLGPLLHGKHKGLPRGVRRAETTFNPIDLGRLLKTVAAPDRKSLILSLTEAMNLYEELRDELAPVALLKNRKAQAAVVQYLTTIQQ